MASISAIGVAANLDDLTAAEAIEIADALCTIVAALPAPMTHDKGLGARVRTP
jgi:hypothetical protein